MSNGNEPLRETMCATCPFRAGSPYANLADQLAQSALHDGCSRICHATGSNALNAKTWMPPHLCRGARDVQLVAMACVGVIRAATDEAWNEKRVELGMLPTVVKDPAKTVRRVKVEGKGNR